VKREGVGELFADGVRSAAEKIGPKSEPFAMDVAGEELPMHDPKLQAEYFATYKLDPTPARHTLYNGRPTDPWGVPAPPSNPRQAEGRGPHHKGASEYMHVVNSVGFCMFTAFGGPNHRIPEWVNAVTGWDTTLPEMLKTG
jgi:aldehyde:ferredoxin oxidoreductase